jgi:hypothetical protein
MRCERRRWLPSPKSSPDPSPRCSHEAVATIRRLAARVLRRERGRGPVAPDVDELVEAYRTAVAFFLATDSLCALLPADKPRLGRQLRKRALVLVLRSAQGASAASERRPRWLARARRSIRECAALLDAFRLHGVAMHRLDRGRHLLARLLALLLVVGHRGRRG